MSAHPLLALIHPKSGGTGETSGLAEAAVLLTLKKKHQNLFEADEES